MYLNITRLIAYRVALSIAGAHGNFFPRVFALAALIGVALVMPAQAQTYYRVTDLGDLPGGTDRSLATDINHRGQIVGASNVTTIEEHAFLWTSEGGMQDLGDLPGGRDGSAATAINSAGQIVGLGHMATGRRALLWTSGGGMQDLGDFPGGQDNSTAYDINNVGQVVGNGSGEANTTHGFLWTSSGGMRDLGTLQGGISNSQAHAINDSGQVVGWTNVTPGVSHAFLWTIGGGMQDLGDLAGGNGSGAYGINASGQVVGSSTAGARGERAFLWTAAGGMQDLGALPLPLASVTGASDINDSGQVVGHSGGNGFLWTSTGGMQDLNNLIAPGTGLGLAHANAINNAGQITGIGVNPSGAFHAYLLTPFEISLMTFTEFEDPALGSANFTPDPASVELGFSSTSSATGGQNPLLGVVNDPARGRVFLHRSINGTTTIQTVDLAGNNEALVSLYMQVGDTTYEAGDFVRAYVTNGVQTIDVVSLTGTSTTDEIDNLAGDGYLNYRAWIPNDWTQATLVISSSTNSTQASEWFDFDSVEFRGVVPIPEPGSLGLVLAALAAIGAWQRCTRRIGLCTNARV